jgi:hypothetical protein
MQAGIFLYDEVSHTTVHNYVEKHLGVLANFTRCNHLARIAQFWGSAPHRDDLHRPSLLIPMRRRIQMHFDGLIRVCYFGVPAVRLPTLRDDLHEDSSRGRSWNVSDPFTVRFYVERQLLAILAVFQIYAGVFDGHIPGAGGHFNGDASWRSVALRLGLVLEKRSSYRRTARPEAHQNSQSYRDEEFVSHSNVHRRRNGVPWSRLFFAADADRMLRHADAHKKTT